MPAILDIDAPGSDRMRLFCDVRSNDLAKMIPGARYDAKQKNFTLPLAWSACLATRGVFGQALTVGPSLAYWSQDERARVEHAAAILAGTVPAPEDDRLAHLFPPQVIGSTWMAEVGRAMLAGEQGTGKTEQLLAALGLLERYAAEGIGVSPFPALVIAPKSMVYEWADRAELRLPGIRTSVVTGTASKRRKLLEPGADLYITTWRLLKEHTRLAPYGSTRLTDKQRTPGELNGGWLHTVIADEAHKAKDPKSQQTRAFWAVAFEAVYRFALTGTPIADTPADAWAIMHGLAPEEYPSRKAFIDRYCNAGLNWFGGLEVYGLTPDPARKAEFFAFFDRRFHRQLKAEVAPWLPPKTYRRLTVEMDTKQAKAYQQMQKHMLAALDDGLLVANDDLSKLTRLLQLADGTPVLDDLGNVIALEEPSCKVDAMLDVLESAPGEPLVVFASSRKLIELCARVLEKKGITHGLITGQVDAGTRAYYVQQFQQGELQVILATTGAGGEGITLTRANRLLKLKRPWSKIEDSQSEDRVHRIGQESNTVEIIDVVTKDTVDYGVLSVLEGKTERLEELTRDRSRIRALIEGVAA